MNFQTEIIQKSNFFKIDKAASDLTVVVAMSGGVDSSVVAALMKKQGYKVIGITLQLFNYLGIEKKPRTCCAGQDIYDAKRVCEKLDIDHYVFNYESKFKNEVIDTFVESYLKGETPIPCVNCNQTVKFRDLLEASKNLNADALVTGHYVKKVIKNGNSMMYRPEDLSRDQTHFLFSTTQEQLDYIFFPLGDISKEETRSIARKLDLIVADKADSQDICFVPNGNYASVIQKIRPDASLPGDIKDTDGNILGKHDGIINFTVGQRKGIKLNSNEPFYVVKLQPETRTVIVGRKEDLRIKKLSIKSVNYLSNPSFDFNEEIYSRVRSTGKLLKSKFNPKINELSLVEPDYGISPGQACVFYKPDSIGTRVLGGGWINATE